MSVRELIARLHVPAARYDAAARGGIPELTNIDIAGALGMIQEEFAREVFCACWWPDGSARSSHDLGRDVLNRIVIEYARRERESVAARLELNIAQCGVDTKLRATTIDREILRSCEAAVTRANAQRWKWDSAAYVRMFDAIIKEIRSPRHCWKCSGRGELFIAALKTTCDVCAGTGKRPHAKKSRAQEIRVPEKDYLRGIGKVYEWAFGEVKDAEERAAKAFKNAVSSVEEQTA